VIGMRIEPRVNGCRVYVHVAPGRCCRHGPGVDGRGTGVPFGGPAGEVTTTTLGPYAERAGLK